MPVPSGLASAKQIVVLPFRRGTKGACARMMRGRGAAVAGAKSRARLDFMSGS